MDAYLMKDHDFDFIKDGSGQFKLLRVSERTSGTLIKDFRLDANPWLIWYTGSDFDSYTLKITAGNLNASGYESNPTAYRVYATVFANAHYCNDKDHFIKICVADLSQKACVPAVVGVGIADICDDIGGPDCGGCTHGNALMNRRLMVTQQGEVPGDLPPIMEISVIPQVNRAILFRKVRNLRVETRVNSGFPTSVCLKSCGS